MLFTVKSHTTLFMVSFFLSHHHRLNICVLSLYCGLVGFLKCHSKLYSKSETATLCQGCVDLTVWDCFLSEFSFYRCFYHAYKLMESHLALGGDTTVWTTEACKYLLCCSFSSISSWTLWSWCLDLFDLINMLSLLEGVQHIATKMVPGLAELPYEERLRCMFLSSLVYWSL